MLALNKPIKASNERRHYTDTRKAVKSFYFFLRQVTVPAEFFLLAAFYLPCCFTVFAVRSSFDTGHLDKFHSFRFYRNLISLPPKLGFASKPEASKPESITRIVQQQVYCYRQRPHSLVHASLHSLATSAPNTSRRMKDEGETAGQAEKAVTAEYLFYRYLGEFPLAYLQHCSLTTAY